MLHCPWDMVRDGCNYFSFWATFYPFTTLTARKIHLKNWKNCLEISSFYISVPKIMMIWHTVPEIWCVKDVIVISHFGLFFSLLSPWQPEISKLKEKQKKRLEISSFYICVPKFMIRWCTFPEICCVADVIVIFNFGSFFALLLP